MAFSNSAELQLINLTVVNMCDVYWPLNLARNRSIGWPRGGKSSTATEGALTLHPLVLVRTAQRTDQQHKIAVLARPKILFAAR